MRSINEISEDIFGEALIVYPFDGPKLKKHREDLGVTQKDFAKMCGWSVKKQKQLENNRKEQRHCSAINRDKIVASFIFLHVKQKGTYYGISSGEGNLMYDPRAID